MNTKNLPLIVGIALPVVFIAIISLVVYLPAMSIRPAHDFLYTTTDGYYGYGEAYKNTFAVKAGAIALDPLPLREASVQTKEYPTLYLYDVDAGASRQISFEDAKAYLLDPGPSSPDGYTVAYSYGHDGIFEIFGSNGDNDGFFVSKGGAKKRLDGLTGDRYWSSGNFKLIGWIK